MSPQPLDQLRQWLDHASETDLRLPHSAVLSTTGLDGYPNARTVAVKDVDADGIVISGPLGSRKGREIAADARCALTMWWDALGRQVRVQGVASLLERERARAIFEARSREARIVASVSHQGEPAVRGALEAAYAASRDTDPTMPDSWGGWIISPQRIEFMEFSDARFHARTLYELVSGTWTQVELQP
ncbi:pyridoxal 5'-phosphate synthase [Demequina sp.]|uniref:pyridoxine/pyridoxamine 5'-phosphate oxidase n=1 Tax=Demequina sp. TaxID=2050685 RepID=UPI0025C58295|nr:pyridoxal 5'-phosphate synthase [Demequina sp.]